MTAFRLQAEKPSISIGFDFERYAVDEGFRLIAGVDEVGRGCLAGPVVAAACILDLTKAPPKGLNDSKKLSAKKRAEISAELKETAVAYAIGQVEAEEIDRINILEATRKAMAMAIAGLEPAADFLLIDAVGLKAVSLPQRSLIKGDAVSFSIAAASVLAKTYRDDMMVNIALEYPQYGFEGHKGYGSAAHLAALREHGPCPLHRRSFRGVL